MKRKTVYRLKLDRVANTYKARLPQLLAVQMALNDVLQNGCMMLRRKYVDLNKQYLEIAEGMLNA